MFRKDFNPFAILLCVGVMIVVAVVTATPVAEPIHSLDETEAMLSQLGFRWKGPGVPVIVFASSGCPTSRAFEAALQREQVHYLRVDVANNSVGREVHAHLGRNYLGTVATRATPTTVVGTRVIRGNDVEEVLQAITAQNQP